MTDIAALIADMVKAGVDAELIGRTAAALAQREPVRVVDEQAERRRAADRERKRLRNSAESAESAEEVSPKKESSPTPPKEKTTPSQSEANASSQKRGCRLPDDFVADLSVAVSLGLHPSQAQTEAAKFADYWRSASGSKAVKRDWEATWRNWVRSAVERLPQSRGSPPRTSTSALADSAARLAQTMRTADEIRSGSSGSGVRAAIPHLSVR